MGQPVPKLVPIPPRMRAAASLGIYHVMPEDRVTWFNNLGSALLIALVAAAAFLFCPESRAHTLTAGECTAFTSDVVRFMKVRSLGYSLEEADDMLRKMFDDQGWFTYVRDKEDVDRVRGVLPKIWDLPDDATPYEVRQSTLNDCDPDNDEQYRNPFQLRRYHGM